MDEYNNYMEQLSRIAELKPYKLAAYNMGRSSKPKFIGESSFNKIFIKITDQKEAIILSEITHLKSEYILGSVIPELLRENIFVADFISEPLNPYLCQEFLCDYFRMQQLFEL